MLNHLAALTIAVLLDRILGDPPSMPHPVRWFGRAISFLEKRMNKGSCKKMKGVLMVLVLLVAVLIVVIPLQHICYGFHPAAGILFEAAVIFTSIAQRSLKEAALDVEAPLRTGDIKKARIKLSYIVGRETDDLQESEIVRGTVETVAENTSDGVTAPLFWAAIGGAPAALLYRLVNTLDSMAGYKSERFFKFGWASARLDDVLNWIPARITAALMLVSCKGIGHWSNVSADAKKHPSPNSGWGEAAAAYLLGIELGGMNTYEGIQSERARMGRPDHPLTRIHILQTVQIMNRTVIAFIVLLWIGGLFLEFTASWI
ncbi:cobalamin biosynthesis protein CobD [Bacillus sp. FJAT-42376]|uniref:adenosylcobinamide-phosphate synthase CbiB n=1 Tax=Bacillus sp. FJAT-42376 TaxID=2014076 RepID=UPI000F4FCAB9|nr:adenosylcobinamide-phosphate synthase CbiB [Bacillus sp. FJAT-42376]AZB42676.1 cobalamin biosynthesis protein CobD [Bacillus sp. FJAT-42376]